MRSALRLLVAFCKGAAIGLEKGVPVVEMKPLFHEYGDPIEVRFSWVHRSPESKELVGAYGLRIKHVLCRRLMGLFFLRKMAVCRVLFLEISFASLQYWISFPYESNITKFHFCTETKFRLSPSRLPHHLVMGHLLLWRLSFL